MLIPVSIARSGTIASGQVAWPHHSSGAVRSGQAANASISSGNIASGQIGWPHMASGAVQSGILAVAGTPDGTLFLRDDFSWQAAGGGLTSGAVNSGKIASGAVQGFFGATRHIASGTIGVFDFGSGAVIAGQLGSGSVLSGNIASGQVGTVAIASGAVTSGRIGMAGTPNGSLFFRDDFTWAAASTTITSGQVQSGMAASGLVQGFFGATRHIASGTIGVFDFGSGAVVAGAVGSGAVESGHIASGVVGPNHIASGAVVSGRASSGAIQGFFGATRHIVSGTVGVFDFGSGAVIATTIGSGAVVSGNIASGVVGQFHIASGAVTSGRLGVAGTPDNTQFLRDDFTWAAASFSLTSGNVQSGHVASGAIQGFFGATKHIASGTIGVFDFGSGAVIAGQMGSGSVLSGNIASGQVGQFSLASGSVVSGRIASGAVQTYSFASGATITRSQFSAPLVSGTSWSVTTEEIISGVKAVQLSPSGTIRIAKASVSGMMPAIGIVFDNVNSGITATVHTDGLHQFSSGMADFSGYLGFPLYVGRSGEVSQISGSWNSGGFLSGDYFQVVGVPINSGGAVLRVADAQQEGFVLSGNIGSGQVGGFHIASGAVTSGRVGMAGTPNGGLFFRDDFTWAQVATASIANDAVTTPKVASGTVQGFFAGAARHILSGTVGVFDFGSGAVIAGQMGSGSVVSGNVASGQLGRFHIASGQLAGFELGSGAIVSGRIASGQIGDTHIASGAVTSGRLGVTGTPDGTLFLRDDFSWQAAGGAVGSGAIGSGKVASGTIQGFFGVTRHIASGTVGVYDFGSGLTAQFTGPFVSGTAWTALTEEIISGVRAVQVSQSGTLRVAMASVSGKMPAIGIVFDNVASGIQANVFTGGVLQMTSGMADYSGYLGSWLYVGRSGQIVTASGSFNSGGLLSGDINHVIGAVRNSGGAVFELAASIPFVAGLVTSGNIASGQVGFPHFANASVQSGTLASGTVDIFHNASGAAIGFAQTTAPILSGGLWNALTVERISGFRAVSFTQSGTIQIAKAAVSGTMPAVGVVLENVESGIRANVRIAGFVQFSSGLADYSGYLGKRIWVGRSGNIVSLSGSFSSAGFASGDMGQALGQIQNSAGALFNVAVHSWSGGPISIQTMGGPF